MKKPLSKNHNIDTTEHARAAYATGKGLALDILVGAKGNTQSTLATAKNVAQSTAANVKDAVQDKLTHTKDFAQSTFKTTRKATRARLANVQDSAKSSLDRAQDLLVAGASIAAALLYEKQRRAQEQLNKARISLLKTATPIVEKTQDVVVTSTRQAGKNIQKVADSARGFKEARQEQYVRYQQKRRRNRTLFRIGLLAGIALALFYTPLAGSDVRQRIAQQWKQYRPYFGL